jgi:hypothetical protein
VPLAHVGAGLGGALEQDLVEGLAADLEGLRARDLRRRGEVDRPAAAAVVRRKARAPLLGEAGGADARLEAELEEGLVGGGEQRLADVEAGEAVALEQHHPVAAVGQGDRGGAAGRAAAGDGEVEVESVRGGRD